MRTPPFPHMVVDSQTLIITMYLTLPHHNSFHAAPRYVANVGWLNSPLFTGFTAGKGGKIITFPLSLREHILSEHVKSKGNKRVV